MKQWFDGDADIGYWTLCVNEKSVVTVHDVGNQYNLKGHIGQRVVEGTLPTMSELAMKREAEAWYVKRLEGILGIMMNEVKGCQAQLKTMYAEEPLVNISDLEYDGEGYMHFMVEADGYALEGLYRLYDPANGPDMTLVSIDFGYLHPIIERQWDRIEMALYDRCLDKYYGILDRSEAFREKMVEAMAAAGYVYDNLESHEGWQSFYGEGGVRVGFDSMHEVAEWLDGVVFDDPAIGDAIERVLHPERVEAKPLNDVLRDAGSRSHNSKGSEEEVSSPCR